MPRKRDFTLHRFAADRSMMLLERARAACEESKRLRAQSEALIEMIHRQQQARRKPSN